MPWRRISICQKWHGITLKLSELETQIKSGKEVIVHWNPQSRHKVLAVIKPSRSLNHELYYHITVEQLWAPESIGSNEDVVLTNFIHGCYYPTIQSFDHIDFSVNQYGKLHFDLLDHYEAFCKDTYGEEKYLAAYEKCKSIRDRETAEIKIEVPAITCVNREYIVDISERAIRDVDNNEFDSALTKSRTILEVHMRHQWTGLPFRNHWSRASRC